MFNLKPNKGVKSENWFLLFVIRTIIKRTVVYSDNCVSTEEVIYQANKSVCLIPAS